KASADRIASIRLSSRATWTTGAPFASSRATRRASKPSGAPERVMWAGVVMAAEVAFPAAVSTGQHRDVEVLQHPPEGGDEGRDHADDLHGDAVQREPAAQRLAPVALLHDPTRGGHAHQPHH